MVKRTFFVFMVMAIFVATQATGVLACSGFPYFGVSDLPEMDLLVRATVIDTDDRGYNAVIRVEDYYKGEGSLFITVMRYPSALSSGALVRGYDTGCLYAGRGDHWVRGSQGYFGLRSNGDGTYTDEYGGTAHFYPVNGEITYQEGATEGYAAEFDEPLTISEEEFVEMMLEAGGREASVSPPTDEIVRYPLMRFLNITTADGTRYQVNPDRSITQLPEDAPLAVSPDGAHVAFRVDDETIAFQYIWTEYAYSEEEQESGEDDRYQVPGQAVRFSPDSNFAAVWDQTQLSIYMFSNYGSSEYGYGTGFNLLPVASVDLDQPSNAPLSQVIWSADTSTIVWEDNSGIWRWNIFDDVSAQQVLTASEMDAEELTFPTLLDVSTHGRYVRIGQPGDWTLIDTVTSESYPYAIAAPTEQFLIFTNDNLGPPPDMQSCTPPLRDNCSTSVRESGVDWTFTYQMNLLGIVSCDSDSERCMVTGTSWHPAVGGTGYSGGRYIDTIISDVRQIAYDAQYNQPALLVGDYRVYFEFYSDYYAVENEKEYRPYLDILNLRSIVDSPIASIEWGQAVFFDEYNLTTSEYFAH